MASPTIAQIGQTPVVVSVFPPSTAAFTPTQRTITKRDASGEYRGVPSEQEERDINELLDILEYQDSVKVVKPDTQNPLGSPGSPDSQNPPGPPGSPGSHNPPNLPNPENVFGIFGNLFSGSARGLRRFISNLSNHGFRGPAYDATGTPTEGSSGPIITTTPTPSASSTPSGLAHLHQRSTSRGMSIDPGWSHDGTNGYALPANEYTGIAFAGAYMGVAFQQAVQWAGEHRVSILLGLVGAIALIVLVAGLYYYYNNYSIYEQAHRDEQYGVTREDTREARQRMEAMRNEGIAPSVKYVAMTPPDYGKLP